MAETHDHDWQYWQEKEDPGFEWKGYWVRVCKQCEWAEGMLRGENHSAQMTPVLRIMIDAFFEEVDEESIRTPE
jgi:hypothetical protein